MIKSKAEGFQTFSLIEQKFFCTCLGSLCYYSYILRKIPTAIGNRNANGDCIDENVNFKQKSQLQKFHVKIQVIKHGIDPNNLQQ